jgi:glc operon protein GlcG
MTSKSITSLLAAAALTCLASLAHAQVPVYGSNVTLDQARKVLAAAVTESVKQKLPMAVAVVDTSGQLVAFERMDNTQTASTMVAQDKASTSAMYRRPSKALQDVLAAGGVGLRVLTLRGVTAVEGGLPIVVDGKIIGAIGVSGGTSEQDGVIAKAGLDGLAAPAK